jgi:hypothetical protein
MVHATVNLTSFRPGGLDITLKGISQQTYSDFEIVFVDSRYHKRHAQVLDYVKKLGIKQPFYHVPEYRYNGDWGVPTGAVNTGLMLAEGEIIARVMDYAWMGSTWLENHLKLHEGAKRYVIGPYHTFHGDLPIVTKNGLPPKRFNVGNHTVSLKDIVAQRDNFDEVSIFTEEFELSLLEKLNPQYYCTDVATWQTIQTGPTNPVYCCIKNDSYPLQSALEIGGANEMADSKLFGSDYDFCCRMRGNGCETWFCKEAEVSALYIREILAKGMIAMPDPPCSNPECEMCNLVREYGLHYWNPSVQGTYSFDIHKRRKEIWHWRELSQKRDPVIPYNNVPNPTYFK